MILEHAPGAKPLVCVGLIAEKGRGQMQGSEHLACSDSKELGLQPQ